MTPITETRSTPRPDLDRLRLGLCRAEYILIGLTLAIVSASLVLSRITGQRIDWLAFNISFLPALGLVLAGLYIRLVKDTPRLAHLAMANGIYVGFAGVISIFLYLRFPIATPLIDPALMRLDAALGFSWVGFTTALADYPLLGRALGWVYLSSLPQLFAVIAILALSGRVATLHKTLLTGTISLVFTIAVWWVFPSVGPTVHGMVDPAVAAAIGLVVDTAYAASLETLVRDGVAVITPDAIIGTIAFPSYHTVMALIAVWYLRGTWAFWPSLALNTAMIPAILSHGGHHMVDVLAGLVCFAATAALSHRIMGSQHGAEGRGRG